MTSGRHGGGSRSRPSPACEQLEDRRLLSAGGPSVGTLHFDGAAMKGRVVANITHGLSKPGARGAHTTGRGHLVARRHGVNTDGHAITGHFGASAGAVHRVHVSFSTFQSHARQGAVFVAIGDKAVSGTFTNGTMVSTAGTLFLDPALLPFGINPPLNLVDIVNILGPVPDPSQIISPNTPGFASAGGLAELPFGGGIVLIDVGI